MKRNYLYRTGRRDFFKKAAYLGAAAVVAGSRAKRAAAAPKPAPVPRTRGNYRMTAHVRRYYQRAAMV